MHPTNDHRRGITLLEVLISVGILAIGLGSIVALVPAARSQANRAVILDRAAVLAANTLADAATFGLLRQRCVTNGDTRPLLVDPSGQAPAGLAMGGLADAGIYGTPASAAAPSTTMRLWAQSRDDVVVGSPASPDAPPTNLSVDGGRAFTGRMTSLLCLQAGVPGGPDRLSVVVFHARDAGGPLLTGTLAGTVLTISSTELAALGGRTVRDLIQPGVVLFANNRLHQVTSAMIAGTAADTYNAFLTLTSGTMLTTGAAWPVAFFPDSVGFAERPFTPESTSPYLQ